MQAPHKCPAVAWVSNPELCGWLYRNKARKNGKRYLDMVEKNRNDGQKLEGSVSFFNHCFELISLLCFKKKRSLKACVNIHHQSVQFFKVQTDPETFQESSCILQKKRKKNKDKEDRVYFGTLLQWLWANVMNTWLWIRKMKYYFKIGKCKTLRCDLCVCMCVCLVFYRIRTRLLAGDQSEL